MEEIIIFMEEYAFIVKEHNVNLANIIFMEEYALIVKEHNANLANIIFMEEYALIVKDKINRGKENSLKKR